MAAKLFGRTGTGRAFAQSLIDRFADTEIELDIILRKVNGIDVYDMCKICHRPVLRTDDYVCQGFLTDERLVHKACVQKKDNNLTP